MDEPKDAIQRLILFRSGFGSAAYPPNAPEFDIPVDSNRHLIPGTLFSFDVGAFGGLLCACVVTRSIQPSICLYQLLTN